MTTREEWLFRAEYLRQKVIGLEDEIKIAEARIAMLKHLANKADQCADETKP